MCYKRKDMELTKGVNIYEYKFKLICLCASVVIWRCLGLFMVVKFTHP